MTNWDTEIRRWNEAILTSGQALLDLTHLPHLLTLPSLTSNTPATLNPGICTLNLSAWNTPRQLKSSYWSFKTLGKHFHTSKAFYALPSRSVIPVSYASKAQHSLFHHEPALFTLGGIIKSVITLNRTFPLDTNNIIPPHMNQRRTRFER